MAGVTVYAKENYKGGSIILPSGDYATFQLQHMEGTIANSISSMRVPRNTVVMVSNSIGFTSGNRVIVANEDDIEIPSMSKLGLADNSIISIKIRSVRTAVLSSIGFATVYQNQNHTGVSKRLTPGDYNSKKLAEEGHTFDGKIMSGIPNNSINCIIVGKNTIAIVYDTNAMKMSEDALFLEGSGEFDLNRFNFRNKVSSIRVMEIDSPPMTRITQPIPTSMGAERFNEQPVSIFSAVAQRGANMSAEEQATGAAFYKGIGVEGLTDDSTNITSSSVISDKLRSSERSDPEARLFTMQNQLGANVSPDEIRTDTAFLRGIGVIPKEALKTGKSVAGIESISSELYTDLSGSNTYNSDALAVLCGEMPSLCKKIPGHPTGMTMLQVMGMSSTGKTTKSPTNDTEQMSVGVGGSGGVNNSSGPDYITVDGFCPHETVKRRILIPVRCTGIIQITQRFGLVPIGDIRNSGITARAYRGPFMSKKATLMLLVLLLIIILIVMIAYGIQSENLIGRSIESIVPVKQWLDKPPPPVIKPITEYSPPEGFQFV